METSATRTEDCHSLEIHKCVAGAGPDGRRAGVGVTGQGCGGVCVSWAIQAGVGPAWANVCHHTHLLKVYLVIALSRKSGQCDKRRLASLERGWSGHTQKEGDASPLRRRHLIHDGAHLVGTVPSGVVHDQPTRPCAMGRVQSPAVPSATQLSDLPHEKGKIFTYLIIHAE